MKSLLDSVEEIENLIRQLQKMASKMNVGQFIPAWRDLNRIIAELDKEKKKLLENAGGKNDK